MNDIMISVENLSKCYRIGEQNKGPMMLREAIIHGIKAPFRNFRRLKRLTDFSDIEQNSPNGKDNSHDNPQKFKNDIIWALKNVSFEINRGEVVGIIGPNGAGKTTLLKIISRITEPGTGDIKLYGRVSSLLEVGTGFHPELTGRENIYLNGAILGMRKSEIYLLFDEIVAFAEINKFIDTPVKRYSSGMYVRLAFAVAAHLNTEIMLVDEVLAVGDAAFQKKCLGKMNDITRHGRTVLFVSHNMGTINSLCNRCILLKNGEIIKDGDTNAVIASYLQTSDQRNRLKIDFPLNSSLPAQIISSCLANKDSSSKIAYQEEFEFKITVSVSHPDNNYHVILAIRNSLGMIVLVTTDCDMNDSPLAGFPGTHEYRIKIPAGLLTPGFYFARFVMMKRDVGLQKGGTCLSNNEDSELAFEIIDNESKRGKTNMYGNCAISPEIPWTHIHKPL